VATWTGHAGTAEDKTSDGEAASHEQVTTGSLARPSECVRDPRYNHTGSQGAWQAPNHSRCGRET